MKRILYSSYLARNLLPRHGPLGRSFRTFLTQAKKARAKFPETIKFIRPRDILVDIHVGTPPRKFTVILDTGSTDLWITHASLSGGKFLPAESKTWKQSRSQWAVKYADSTIIEGIEGVEKVVLGTKEFDARVGVAQRIWEETAGGKLVNKDRITGIKAGTMGYKDVDGILGIGLGSSTIAGLRETGVRCLKLSFRKENSGRDEMELLTDIDQEQNVVWYPVKAQDGEATWGVVLNKVTYGPRSLSAPRGTKMLVDTGNVHISLPVATAQTLFGQSELSKTYVQVYFATDYLSANEDAESGWLLLEGKAPASPVLLEFANSKVQWPLGLNSPLKDGYASIRCPPKGGKVVLGMPFISTLRSILFDFTEGKEKVGFRSWDDVTIQNHRGVKPWPMLLYSLAGVTLGLGFIGVWILSESWL